MWLCGGERVVSHQPRQRERRSAQQPHYNLWRVAAASTCSTSEGREFGPARSSLPLPARPAKSHVCWIQFEATFSVDSRKERLNVFICLRNWCHRQKVQGKPDIALQFVPGVFDFICQFPSWQIKFYTQRPQLGLDRVTSMSKQIIFDIFRAKVKCYRPSKQL